MVGPTVGHVEIKADVDASALDRQIRAFSNAMAKSFSTSLEKNLKGFVEELDGAGDGLDDVSKKSGKADKNMQRLTKTLKNQSSIWKNLSANTRQWTLIIGAIAAGGQDIATLGSALGPGLMTLGSLFTSIGIAGGTAIAVFKGLNGELEDLPAAVRPAAAAFQRIGDAFDDLQDAIQVAALEDAEGAFDSIADTVKQLTPAFEKVAKSIGKVIKQFAEGIKPGTKNFDNLNKIISDSADVFEDLMRIVGKFGTALGNVFASDAATKSVQDLLGWVEKLSDKFLDFTEHGDLDTWFARASQIFGALGRLLEATATALADLVDKGAVDRLVGFLDNLTGFMPSLETLLSILGELDVFGLIAQALNDFGKALEPLAGPMEELAGAVSEVISAGIETLAPVFQDIAEELAPFVQGLADLMEEDPEGVAKALLALAAAAVILKGAKGIAGLAPKVTKLTGALKGLAALGGALGILALIFETLAFERDSDWFKDIDKKGDEFFNKGVPAWFESAFTTIDKWGNDLFNVTIPGWFEGLFTTIDTWGNDLFNVTIPGWFVGLFTSIDTWGNDFFNVQIPAWFNGLLTGVGAFILGIVASVVTWWNEGWANFAASAVNGWDQIVTWFESLRTAVNTWVLETFWPGVVTWWNEGWAATVAAFANGWDQLVTWWTGIVTSVSTWFTETFWPGVVTWWNDGWTGATSSFTNGWSQLVTWWEGLKTGVSTWFTNFWASVVNWWNSGWAGVGRSLGNGWSVISGWFEGISSGFRSWLQGFIDTVNRGLAKVKELTGGFVNLQIPKLPGMAAGGVVAGPMRALIGEAGPEAVVPLTRPLSLVDPAVRPLAAFARGEMASGGIAGGGKTVTVMPGAIVIQSSINPINTATAVLDRIVSRL